MAYTQVQVISDTDRRHVVKRVNFANNETNALVVNAAALAYAVVTVTTQASANNFQVGETVNAASGGSGIVQDILSPTTVTLINTQGTFTPGTTLTGATSGRVRVQDGSVVPAQHRLEVSRIIYNITENGDEVVTLMWEGTGDGANNRSIAALSGSGVLDLAVHGARVPNNANSATGNITLTTDHWGAKSAYTLVLDVSKNDGYAAPYLQRNVLGHY